MIEIKEEADEMAENEKTEEKMPKNETPDQDKEKEPDIKETEEQSEKSTEKEADTSQKKSKKKLWIY